MDLKMKQAPAFEFLVKEEHSLKEIYNRLKNVYEHDVMDISRMRGWVKIFPIKEIAAEWLSRSSKIQVSQISTEHEDNSVLGQGVAHINILHGHPITNSTTYVTLLRKL